jgi:lipid-A-disaccharide synthase
MPGSRRKEVAMNLPTILAAAAQLGPGYEFLLPVAPTLDPHFLRQETQRAPALKTSLHLVPESLPALRHSRAGIVASGTATVEAALMNTPFVMVYRVSPMTYLLGRSQVKAPYFAMVNLIAGAAIIPELVQHDFTAERVVHHLQKILPDGSERESMLAGLASVRTHLRGAQGAMSAPDRAAAIIQSMVATRPS